ncbi:MAG: amino acid adenylation domain-containing protein [Pirellulales bacterium]
MDVVSDKVRQVANLPAADKRKLLEELLRKKAAEALSPQPLSHGQRAMWLTNQLAPQSAAYNFSSSATIRTAINVEAFERALRRVMERHTILRTTYSAPEGEPLQQVQTRIGLGFEQHDASSWTAEQFERRLAAEADRPFDLARGPIMRTILFSRAPYEHVLLLVVHHIAVDFWSLPIVMEELRLVYAAECAGSAAPLPPVGRKYTDFVKWQQEFLAGPDGERLWSYWQKQLAGDLATLDLPTDRPRPPVQTYRGANHTQPLGAELTAQLKALAKAEGVTLYVLLTAAFQTLLHRYTGQDDVLVGSPMAGRTRSEWETVVGYFANPVVLRANFAGDPTFQAVVQQVRGTVLGALEHQDMPFPLVVERMKPARDPSRAPLFQVMIAWEKAQRAGTAAHASNTESPTSASQPAELKVDELLTEQRGAAFDITLQVYEAGGALSCTFQYNTDLFDQATIARMASHLRELLAGAAANPRQAVSLLPLLPAEEKQQLLAGWNNTARPEPGEVCLHTLIEQQVERTPDAIALTFDNQSLTYRELNARANQLAHALRNQSVGRDSIVGVAMERSLELIISLLGVIKAGGAYLPLDPDYPAERLAYMLEDANVAAILTQAHLTDKLPPCDAARIILDADCAAVSGESRDNPAPLAQPGDLAYVIYTSGSTGRPKGAMNTHRAICNRLVWMQNEYQLCGEDCVVQKTPYSFDVSVWEFFWPLLTGAKLVVAKPGGHRDPEYLAKLIAEQRVTTLHFVPSMLQIFLSQPGIHSLSSLKRVICSGEALPLELQEEFFQTFATVELHNLYGPTEAAVDVTYWACERNTQRRTVPIGRPIANTQIHILDHRLQPTPIGVPGELHIGGVNLARGYLNKAELTAEKFIADPFSSQPGARLYKTGDLARWTADGVIEYLGRLDHQVKIRGFRIELGEIETVLQQHAAVRECVVMARQDEENEKRLVAYVVPNGPIDIDIAELRSVAAAKLPQYMQPAAYVQLDSLPLSANGKVDRRALPVPERNREASTPYVAPRTRAERVLAKIWADVLHLERVGVDDEFFELGGASNQAIQIVSRANELGLFMNPELFFQNPTIALLAAAAETPPQPQLCNSKIESLGVYLPEKVVSTKEVLAGCAKKITFPLERLTGIKNRHVVDTSKGESAIYLAQKAIEECFKHSACQPGDIEMIVCCNICRMDGPNFNISYEPSTAIKLCEQFGMPQAMAFDINNACSGMFTGVNLVNQYIKLGLIRRGMVVSGEYITHLSDVAQREIDSHMDPKLACLTLGDSGAAMILERTDDRTIGFHELDLFTLGQYSGYCVAKQNDSKTAAIMITDLLGVSSVITKEGVAHWSKVVARSDWKIDDITHFIPHQTSKTSLANGLYEAQNGGTNAQQASKLICNVVNRANTATTSYFLALWDYIHNGKIKSGDKIMFGVSGSGINIGGALYTLDDLPDRLRGVPRPEAAPQTGCMEQRVRKLGTVGGGPRVAIEGVGLSQPVDPQAPDTVGMARAAAEDAFARAANRDKHDVGLVMHTGLYRSEFLCEPAVATIVAGDLGLNQDAEKMRDFKTFAFDLINGSAAFLQACYTGLQAIRFGRMESVVVTASEIENNGDRPQALPQLGIREVGSAVVLGRSTEEGPGFGNFLFTSDTAHVKDVMTNTAHHEGVLCLGIQQDPTLHDHYLEAVVAAVPRLLEREGLALEDIKHIFPPQISPDFIGKLAQRLGVAQDQMIDATAGQGDLYTSSLPHALRRAQEENRVQPGDIGLFLTVGSGIQVAAAVYYF